MTPKGRARTELQAALPTLLERCPALEREASPPARVPFVSIRWREGLPIRSERTPSSQSE